MEMPYRKCVTRVPSLNLRPDRRFKLASVTRVKDEVLTFPNPMVIFFTTQRATRFEPVGVKWRRAGILSSGVSCSSMVWEV